MQKYQLYRERDVAALPEDDEKAFISFVQTCRRNFDRLLPKAEAADDVPNLRSCFMAQVAAAAIRYEIDGRDTLKVPPPTGMRNEHFDVFAQAVQQMVTGLELGLARDQRSTIRTLTPSSIVRIRHTLGELKTKVAEADLPAGKTAKIHKLIDEIEAELVGRGFDLGKALKLFAVIATIVNQGEQALIHLPQAITTVITLAGGGQSDTDAPVLEGPAEVLKLADQRPA